MIALQVTAALLLLCSFSLALDKPPHERNTDDMISVEQAVTQSADFNNPLVDPTLLKQVDQTQPGSSAGQVELAGTAEDEVEIPEVEVIENPADAVPEAPKTDKAAQVQKVPETPKVEIPKPPAAPAVIDNTKPPETPEIPELEPVKVPEAVK